MNKAELHIIESERFSHSMNARFHQVPRPLMPLLGRQQEVQAAVALLLRPEVHLLTLTGTGGVGKTRLALEIAANLQETFAAGICFVPLAAIHDPELVQLTIAHALGLKEVGDLSPLVQLKPFLRERHLLLLLDNFEQVLATAPLLTDLLSACPQLKLLLTSRAVLRVEGEYEFPVLPLTVPDLHQRSTLDALSQIASVALFVQRLQAIVPDFRLTEDNAAAVADICVRLDGLPLALELAAARFKLLPLSALLSRLENRLDILTRGRQDAPLRQQTLRNTIAWSYDLLSPEEKCIFRRLAVFVGGCSLEAAEAVCSAPGDHTTPALDGGASLLHKSLLYKGNQEGEEVRLLMLETIREYALERLLEDGEMETVRDIHAAYYLALSEEAEPALHGMQQGIWMMQLKQECDNLRAALRWLLERNEKEKAARLAGSLLRFWILQGYLIEGLHWVEQALGGTEQELSTAVRIKALFAAGTLAGLLGNTDQATTRCLQCLALCRETMDSQRFVQAASMLSHLAAERGDYAQAQTQITEALTVATETGDTWARAYVLHCLGFTAIIGGEYVQARKFLEEALLLFTEVGDLFARVQILRRLGELFLAQGDASRALTYLDEGFTLASAIHDSWTMSWLLNLSGQAAILRGNARKAGSLLEEALTLHKNMGEQQGLVQTYLLLARVAALRHDSSTARDFAQRSVQIAMKVSEKRFLADSLEGLAGVVAEQGQFIWAVRLWGKAEAVRQAIHAPMPPVERISLEHGISMAGAALGEADVAACWAQGQAMTPEQVLAAPETSQAAPSASSASPAQEPAPAPPEGLTRREGEVLRLLADGLSNQQIAEALVISPRTVNIHVQSLYRKLNVSSRAAAARYSIEHRLRRIL